MHKAKRKRSVVSRASSNCCRTCRLRRVRCDEQRPSCQNCIAQGRECGGYRSWEISLDALNNSDASSSTPDNAQIIPSLERTNQNPNVPLSILRTNSIDINDETRHAYDFFRYQSYGNFVARGYPVHWADFAISLGLSEPAIFYAMGAVGAAEQANTYTIHTSLARPANTNTQSLAFQLYSKAISNLREPIKRALTSDSSLDSIIISCVIFVVFSVVTNNHVDAIRHARNGRRILEERLRRQSSTTSTPTSSGSPEQLPDVAQLAFARSTPGDESHMEVVNYPVPGVKPVSSFASQGEASAFLEALTEAGQDLRAEMLKFAEESMPPTTATSLSTASNFCLTHSWARVIATASRDPFRKRLENIGRGLRNWEKAFTSMMESGQPLSKSLLYLQIRFFQESFMLALAGIAHEQQTDRFVDQCVHVLDVAERLLRQRVYASLPQASEPPPGPIADEFIRDLDLAKRRSRSASIDRAMDDLSMGPEKPPEQTERYVAGVFEFGIIPALFTIACKCRTSHVRRRAAKLLYEANRVEAMESSMRLAKYAEVIMNLEEQQARESSDRLSSFQDFYADEVPEAVRFMDVVVSTTDGDIGELILSCTRLVQSDIGFTGEIELLEYKYSGEPAQCVGQKKLGQWHCLKSDEMVRSQSF